MIDGLMCSIVQETKPFGLSVPIFTPFDFFKTPPFKEASPVPLGIGAVSKPLRRATTYPHYSIMIGDQP